MANFFRYLAASALAFVCAVAVTLTLSYGNNNDSDEWSSMASELLAKAQPPPSTAMSAAALQKLERIHVMKCAKDITGSDKPRKLAPKLRNEVLKCANHYMPPVKTKALLAASAKELMSAAKTPAQKKDAQKVLAKALGGSKPAAKPAVASKDAARARIAAKATKAK